ncbi:hypothetical protein [Nitrosopumilus sp. b1]|uniref:hypothetical protein n=1 Tax=Nitrosopumilus sp. b1 TaxID=2109907 RepID=UPI0015F61BAB|nr:hypothetical protein [Nitrosopumilus sp. b1]
MGLFSRKKQVVISNICPVCKMKFDDPERTLKHITKAHPKKKKFNCDTCGFNN